MADKLLKKGYVVVSFVARGCGGVPLTSSHPFTAARTSDLHYAVLLIRDRYPNRSLFAAGFSLGAGTLLKYLGEQGRSSVIDAAVCVSPAWNYHIVSTVFWMWSRYRLVGE